ATGGGRRQAGGARSGEVGQHYEVLDAGQPGEDALHDLAAVEVAPAVAVAVHGEHHLGLDLGEAVDHTARAELGGGARPNRADARRGEQRDERLGDVGHV